MCKYVCVYVSVCMCVCVRMCMYVRLYVCVCMYKYVCVYVCTNARMQKCLSIYFPTSLITVLFPATSIEPDYIVGLASYPAVWQLTESLSITGRDETSH